MTRRKRHQQAEPDEAIAARVLDTMQRFYGMSDESRVDAEEKLAEVRQHRADERADIWYGNGA